MRKINIITDSTSDLSPELIAKNEITILPLFVHFGEETYRDGIDITTEALYEKVSQYKSLPKSAAIPPAQFHQTFASFPEEEDIIFTGIGSNFSATFHNATIAAEDFPNVYLIDSANLSSGIGLIVLKICKYRDQGCSAQEIIQKMEDIIPNVRTQFAINTLEYLHMGGRCSGTSRIFGTLLSIKPIIRVIDGQMEVAKKPLGKFNKALQVLLDYVDHDLDILDDDYMMVTHSLAGEDANYLISQLKNKVKVKEIVETNASGVISTHCGPRTIGILYIVKNRAK